MTHYIEVFRKQTINIKFVLKCIVILSSVFTAQTTLEI